jgi:hypothetical protein
MICHHGAQITVRKITIQQISRQCMQLDILLVLHINIRWADDKRKFGVRDAPIDHIALVGESMDGFLNSGKCPGWIKIWSSMPEKYKKKKKQSCVEVFWQVWVRDREWRKYEARPLVGECFASPQGLLTWLTTRRIFIVIPPH